MCTILWVSIQCSLFCCSNRSHCVGFSPWGLPCWQRAVLQAPLVSLLPQRTATHPRGARIPLLGPGIKTKICALGVLAAPAGFASRSSEPAERDRARGPVDAHPPVHASVCRPGVHAALSSSCALPRGPSEQPALAWACIPAPTGRGRILPVSAVHLTVQAQRARLGVSAGATWRPRGAMTRQSPTLTALPCVSPADAAQSPIPGLSVLPPNPAPSARRFHAVGIWVESAFLSGTPWFSR